MWAGGCLLWLWLPPGAFPQQILDGGRPDSELVWPNARPHQRLGSSGDKDPKYKAEIPAGVLEAAARVLADDPADWGVFHLVSYAGQQKEIVYLHDLSMRSFICLVEPDRWVRLNDALSLPIINEIMSPSLSLLGDLKDPVKLVPYVRNFAGLYQGNCRFILSRNFWFKEFSGAWLCGSETNPAAMQALCVDPMVTGPEGTPTIQCYFLNYWGAVERWTLSVRAGKTLEVTKVAIEKVRENGTFSIGLVGS